MSLEFSHLDFRLDTVEANGNAWEKLDAIREADPLFWSDSQNGWLVTRHEDVRKALNDRRLSVERITPIFATLTPEQREKYDPIKQSLTKWMLLTDDQAMHNRLRKFLLHGFATSIVEGMRGLVEECCTELFDELEAKEGSIGWIGDFAHALPAFVVMELVGMPRDRLADFQRWSWDIITLVGTPNPGEDRLDAALAAIVEMEAFYRDQIEMRRADPRDDMLTAMIQASDEEDKLSTEEIVATCGLLMIAGHQTTQQQLGNSMLELIRHPEQRDYFINHPDKLRPMSEELQRYCGVINAMARVAMEDFEWHGKQVKKGDVIWILFHAANRDPRMYENPNELDLSRENSYPLAFGPGVHFCLGHQMAKMELEVALRMVWERFEKIELMDKEIQWTDSIVHRGLSELNVRLTPRRQALSKAAE